MPFLSLLITLIVIGVVVWAVTSYVPMDAGIKRIIQIVGILIAVIYVLYAFGVMGSLQSINVPRLR